MKKTRRRGKERRGKDRRGGEGNAEEEEAEEEEEDGSGQQRIARQIASQIAAIQKSITRQPSNYFGGRARGRRGESERSAKIVSMCHPHGLGARSGR